MEICIWKISHRRLFSHSHCVCLYLVTCEFFHFSLIPTVWSFPTLVSFSQLESLLSRESIIKLVDPFICNLLISSDSPDMAISVDDLVVHPRLTGALADMVLEVREGTGCYPEEGGI